MRNTFCRSLILLRNKNLIPALDLLELFFQLLRCPDKSLRSFLEKHIITDIKNMNAKHKDTKLNATLQNFMYSMLKDSYPKAAKMSVDIMIELYNKNIWNDAKTVNVIATVGCQSKITKVQVASLKFFLGKDEDEKDSDSESDNEPDLKMAMNANKVNKKTKKRKKQLETVKKLVIKAQKKKSAAPSFNFSAIHLLHNPQGMAEDLFKQLQSGHERFEVKLMHLDVISRLIGLHDLFLFSFYPYITRFLQPHQRQVTRILQFAAQASHDLVPGDIVEPVIKTVVHNFVTERNSSDVMAIGLNAIREICARCPLAMNEELLKDLVMYKSYKEKSVMMAAKSLIFLYREQVPTLLHKRDRGRPTEASVEIKPRQYGEVHAYDHIPGAEALLNEATKKDIGSDSEDSDGGWVDVDHSDVPKIPVDSENEESDDEEVDDEEDEGEEGEDEDGEGEEESDDEEEKEEEEDDGQPKIKRRRTQKSKEEAEQAVVQKKQAAQDLALTKIFTDEDFKRIDMLNIKKHVTNSRKRPLPMENERQDFVKLGAIEMIHKKRKNDKQARIDSVKAGQMDREKFGYKDNRLNIHCSKTNREKSKKKPVMMMRAKARGKIKKSFKDKQVALRNHLTKQRKMK